MDDMIFSKNICEKLLLLDIRASKYVISRIKFLAVSNLKL